MKTRTRSIALMTALAVLAGLLALSGCSSDTSTPSSQAVTGGDDYQNMDFSQPYGGLTASDEEVAFGDKAFSDMLFAEDMGASDDPLQEDPEVMRMEAMAADSTDTSTTPRPRFTFVRLEWGMIHGPIHTLDQRTGCPDLDWSGTIYIDRGLLVVTRLIRFELPRDTLVRPRVNGQSVSFISHTFCRSDGLMLKIIERPEDLDGPITPNMLHIATGPYQGDFPISDLVGMDANYPVDDEGNSLQLNGYALDDIHFCPKGFLHGRYSLLPDPAVDAPADGDLTVQYGTFGGPWFGLDGMIRGFMRCGYGLDANGAQVFFGKRIGRFGRFEAFLSGTWTAGEDGISLAGFSGHWSGPAGNREGVLAGTGYPIPDYPGGFYDGRWSTLCDPEAVDQVH